MITDDCVSLNIKLIYTNIVFNIIAIKAYFLHKRAVFFLSFYRNERYADDSDNQANYENHRIYRFMNVLCIFLQKLLLLLL